MATLKALSELGRIGMLNSQAQMAVTGKNIANVNTEGYSRQRLDITPQLPFVLAGYAGASALSTESHRQIRDEFTDQQFRSQNSLYHLYDTTDSILTQLEGILPADNESGLRSMLDEFWMAWDSLSNDPESNVAREIVFNTADTLATTYRRLHREVVNLQTGVSNEIEATVTKINNVAAEIAALNEADPGDNLDITDQRNRLIDELSKLTNIEVANEGPNISVSVSGLMIVAGIDTFEMSIAQTSDSQGVGSISINIGDKNVKTINITGGVLGGLMNVYNDDITNHIDMMDIQVLTLVDEVNALHQTGFALDGTTGLNFFKPSSVGAANIDFDPIIAGDRNKIAASDTLGVPGNGGIARAIAELRDEQLIGTETINEHYRTMIVQLGSRIQQSAFLKSSQDKVVGHLQLKRDSVAGVSMEEEMTLMMQLEQSFAAAAKMVQIADEMTRTLLALI